MEARVKCLLQPCGLGQSNQHSLPRLFNQRSAGCFIASICQHMGFYNITILECGRRFVLSNWNQINSICQIAFALAFQDRSSTKEDGGHSEDMWLFLGPISLCAAKVNYIKRHCCRSNCSCGLSTAWSLRLKAQG